MRYKSGFDSSEGKVVGNREMNRHARYHHDIIIQEAGNDLDPGQDGANDDGYSAERSCETVLLQMERQRKRG